MEKLTSASNGELANDHSITSDHTNGHDIESATTTSSPPEPIAICGMACRLPSGIKTPQQLWEFLLTGNDARSGVPESRYSIEAFYDPSGKPGTTKTQHGYFLDENLAGVDTSFYSMPRKEVERLDPQQRLMLEVARECFEDAGETGWREGRLGATSVTRVTTGLRCLHKIPKTLACTDLLVTAISRFPIVSPMR